MMKMTTAADGLSSDNKSPFRNVGYSYISCSTTVRPLFIVRPQCSRRACTIVLVPHYQWCMRHSYMKGPKIWIAFGCKNDEASWMNWQCSTQAVRCRTKDSILRMHTISTLTFLLSCTSLSRMDRKCQPNIIYFPGC